MEQRRLLNTKAPSELKAIMLHSFHQSYATLQTNYILFKTGDDDFQKLLDKVFREKAKIKDIVYFHKFYTLK